MTIPADHCEAKLHGFRRTQDGVVVSFVIHPQQVPECLALDPLGTRYQLAMAQIGDDEKPVVLTKQQRTSWANMPASQQAALACQDAAFQGWLAEKYNSPKDTGEEVTVERLRHNLGVKSRADLDRNSGVNSAAVGWRKLYADFEQWAGRTSEP